MQEPRPYQVGMIEQTRAAMRGGARRVLLQLGTGGGKTVIACIMIGGALDRSLRSLFVAHRKELIEQASARLAENGIPSGVVMAGVRPRPQERVQVGSIQTLCARGERPPAAFIFVDEAHRTPGASYRELLAAYPDAWIVGLTATPYRLDGQGLGQTYQALVQGPPLADLVDQGYLVDCDMYAPGAPDLEGVRTRDGEFVSRDLEERVRKRELVGDLVSHWLRLGHKLPTVAFGVSVAHSIEIASRFCAMGIRAEHLDGTCPRWERAAKLERLATGKTQILSNCDVLTEGWDCPPVGCAIVARPTMSLSLFKQMGGRILRPFPGKARAVILDHGGNCRRHGHILDEVPVTLEDGVSRRPTESGEGLEQIRTCLQCYAVARGRPETCPQCGADFPRQERQGPDQVEGELERVERGALRPEASDTEVRRKLRSLRTEASARGYKPGWVFHKLSAIYGRARAMGAMGQDQEAGHG